ncbi:MAG: hypothetical protein U1C97_00695, partial [Candidatus Gracilibacteria bacterium]|nr:hypothetical protein [Candidatus Gracilibacteria bacterium]
MKAFIVGQMMTGEGKKLDVGQALDQIEKLYNKIQGFLDPKAGKTKQTITKKWLKQGLELANEQIKSELKVKLKILHEESPWKHKSLDAEIEDFLGFGLNSDGSESYSRMISRALSEMKVAQFRQQMHKREKELNADASETEGAGKTESNQFFIDEAAENIKDAFLDFQKQRYTMERIIQELPSAIDNDSGIELEGHVADGTTKQQLTDAAHFLVHYEGWTRGEVRTAIGMALKSSSDIEFFLEQRKQEMLNKHCSKEERVRVQNSLNNDPKFDVFRYLNDRFDEERERQDAEEENETDRSNRYPYLEGEILNQVRKILDKMESLTQGDVDGYKKLQDELTSAVKGQEYLIEEAEERDGKATGSFVPRSVPKQYPQEEMMRINAIRYRHQHANKYKDLLKLKPKILQAALSSDAELQKVLVVLMFNAKDKGNEVLGQASKLAKVMSLKHPTTCIRFNAAKKEPFVNQDDSYQMLDKKGQWTATQPASFHERSTELIRMVQEKLKEGNYQGIEDLFKTGKAGDRLWSDARFFPVSKLQTEVERSQTGQPGEKGITYEIQLDQEGKSGKVLSSQIPKKLRSRFDGREFKALEKSMAKDQEYQDFRGLPPRLEEDEAFRRGFGTLTEHEIEKEIRTGTSVLGAGVFPDEPRPISEERIAELKKEWPLVAVRAQQLNSEMGGWALAAPQMGVRYVGDTLRQVAWDIPTTTLGLFAKDITFISPLSFIRSISEVIEHISALQNWKVQIQSYNLLKEVFKGTIWGAEFQKLYQAKDDERVNQFKSTFAAFGL